MVAVQCVKTTVMYTQMVIAGWSLYNFNRNFARGGFQNFKYRLHPSFAFNSKKKKSAAYTYINTVISTSCGVSELEIIYRNVIRMYASNSIAYS